MDDRRLVKVSKYLSRHLRHDPGRIGIELDEQGWVEVDALLKALERQNFRITPEELDEVVARNDKQRFALRDGKIRANQGHTVEVDLDLAPADPPPVLFHGTTGGFLDAIRAGGPQADEPARRAPLPRPRDRDPRGLAPRQARGPRGRRGTMAAQGHLFYRSDNGVWLTEHVPAWAIMFPG